MRREGFEPPKAQGQQIYSLPRLTTSLPALEPLAGIEPATYTFTYTPPSLHLAYKRVRLYLEQYPANAGFSSPCQSFERLERYGLAPPWRGINRYSGFNVKFL